MEQLITIGKIIKPHGIRGEMKVKILTEDPEEHFAPEEPLILVSPDGKKKMECHVESSRIVGNGMLLCVEEILDATQAENCRDWLVKTPMERLVLPQEDEYFVFDLVGLSVSTTDGVLVGKLIKVLPAGHHDLYEIEHPETKKKNLIPAKKEFIKDVNLKKKTMIIEPIEGLIEL